MQSGFLLGSKPSPTHQSAGRSEVISPAAGTQPQDTPEVAAAAAPPPPSRQLPTREQAEAGLAQCLELLKGPTDERRFVGLLLVTKLLPAGDEATILRVHAAVGPTFLARLLLPLKTSAAPLAGLEAAQQAVASAALGLAVLASFVRVPELAAGEEVLAKLPLLLNVARAGGIAPLLVGPSSAARGSCRGGGGGGMPAAPALAADAISDPAAEAAAVLDALECAVAAARSGDEGRAVAAESGALAAAAAVLQRCPAAHTQQLSLALQLMGAVLAGERQRAELLMGDPATLLDQLLPALARLFALPAQQLAASLGGTSGASNEELLRQLLAIQLEALHVLALLLPLPQPAEELAAEQLAAGGPAAWPAQLRQGLALLLRGRISAVQRHAALQLAAAVVDLAGPSWVLDGPGPAPGGGKRAVSAAAGGGGKREAEAFYQLLVEVTKVETSVLLHDALAPGVQVPLASAAATAAADWRAPAPRRAAGDDGASSGGGSEAGDGLHEAGAELAADLAGADDADVDDDMAPLVRVLESEQDLRQMQAQLQREQQEAEAAEAVAAAGGVRRAQPGDHVKLVDSVEIPTDMRWEGPTEASGARAARMLPCCFSLLEACIEALAADTQRAEAGPGAAAPALSDAVAQRALFSLQEAVEVVLQFIEQTACEEEPPEEGQPLLLAALRVLARFCAEVPEAFGGRLRPLLPTLLSLRADSVSVAAATGEPALPPAEGPTFLLPLLLQISDPGYGADGSEQQQQEQQLWLEALGEQEALCHLVLYALQCAACCAPAATTAAATAADDALLYACQLLLNVATAGGEHGGDSEGAARQRQVRQLLATAPEALQLLEGLLALAQQRLLTIPPGGSPHPALHAARLLSVLAALGGMIAASVAMKGEGGGSLASQQQDQELLPGLGPISGRQMQMLCTQLLAALQAATVLTCSKARCRQLALPLATAAGDSGSQAAVSGLAAARAAVQEDEDLQLELLRSLDVAAAEAAVLLQRYPPFAALARGYPFVVAELAAAELAAAGAMSDSAAETPPGLALFLAAAAEAL